MTSAVELRHALHAYPELSGREAATAARVVEYFASLAPDETLTGIAGHGVAFVFGDGGGPTVMLRCELDALPIAESGDLPYRSRQPGVSHKCGHDGHMAILAEVGRRLATRRPSRGRVVLLFQPAEETSAGARAVVADPQFEAIRPDRVYGLHNVPGYPLGRVVVRDGTFCCASRGLAVTLAGRPAHAAQPETGVSPAAALAELIAAFADRPAAGSEDDLCFATVVGATTGGRNFGVAPGSAELCVTLRAASDASMAALVDHAESCVHAAAARHGLAATLRYDDVFDATVNSAAAVDTIRSALAGDDVCEADEPFRWSEDFGRYTQVAEGAFFGLGAGDDQPDLHDADYDFPDALIDSGARAFLKIVERSMLERTG